MINKWVWPIVVMVLVLFLASLSSVFQGDTGIQSREISRAYTPHEPIRINSDDEFDSIAQQEGWSGSGGYLSPYIIENYEIDGHGDTAFYIGNTTRYFLLRYSHLYNFSSIAGRYNEGVVEFYNVQNGEVYGCNITYGQYGVYITAHSSENSVEYNTFYNVTNGVYLYFYTTYTTVNHNEFHYGVHVGTAITVEYYSDDNSIWYNTVDGPSAGVYINGQSGGCTGNVISRNEISNTRDYGVYVYESPGNRVENNTIRNSMNEGIRVYIGSSTVIANNSIIGSIGYGIDVNSADNAIIYNNSLVNNNGAADSYDPLHVQATNNGTNQWYYKNRGNYWSDWTSPDSNNDGIVDNPYALDGDSGSQDPYPLAEPPTPIPELNAAFVMLILLLALGYFVKRR